MPKGTEERYLFRTCCCDGEGGDDDDDDEGVSVMLTVVARVLLVVMMLVMTAMTASKRLRCHRTWVWGCFILLLGRLP